MSGICNTIRSWCYSPSQHTKVHDSERDDDSDDEVELDNDIPSSGDEAEEDEAVTSSGKEEAKPTNSAIRDELTRNLKKLNSIKTEHSKASNPLKKAVCFYTAEMIYKDAKAKFQLIKSQDTLTGLKILKIAEMFKTIDEPPKPDDLTDDKKKLAVQKTRIEEINAFKNEGFDSGAVKSVLTFLNNQRQTYCDEANQLAPELLSDDATTVSDTAQKIRKAVKQAYIYEFYYTRLAETLDAETNNNLYGLYNERQPQYFSERLMGGLKVKQTQAIRSVAMPSEEAFSMDNDGFQSAQDS